MKHLFIFLSFLLAATTVGAQNEWYECTYQEKLDLGDKVNSVDEAALEFIKAFLEKRKSFYTLTFADGKSLFEKNRELSDDDMTGDAVPVYFTDFGDGMQTVSHNFFGRTFIITDSLELPTWTLVEEQSEIGGRLCAKATTGDSVVITAWYSLETRIPAGPLNFVGLPGLVVELEMGPVTYTLTEMKVLDKDPKLKVPSKGKKVTKEEYEEIVKKKMEEHGFSMPGGGGVKVIGNF